MGANPSTVTSKMERQTETSGDNPLIGRWKQIREGSWVQSTRVTFSPRPNGLHVRYEGPVPEDYDWILNGNEHTVHSPRPNTKLTVRKLNDRSVEERWTRDGKTSTTVIITVSADGKELIERRQPATPNVEPSEYV
jgi:hypothetical protein